jgi:ABC-type branched-subunit amino acid transport system substrate-binding protein
VLFRSAYFNEVNRRGGVAGRKLVLLAYDDGYEPLPAIDNTLRLIEERRALLLFGYVGTPTVTKALPVLAKHRDEDVLLFFSYTGAQPLRERPYGDLVFNLRASYRQETEGLVSQFIKLGRRRVAVFYQADAYGRSGIVGVTRALARYGLAPVAEATYRRGARFDTDMSRQVEILWRGRPEAVIAIGAYAACAAFVRQVREAGWEVPIANVSFAGSDAIAQLLTAAERRSGKVLTSNLINSQVVPSYEDTRLPAAREYRRLMDHLGPSLPPNVPPPADGSAAYAPLRYSYASFEGFLDAKLLVAILRRMDMPERARLRAAAESLRDFDLGIGPPVSFGPRRHQGLDAVYYTVYEGGRFVPLADWGRWRLP